MIAHNSSTRLITSLVLCLLAGYANLYFFLSALPVWYAFLQKPSSIPSVTIIYYAIIAFSLLMAFGMYFLWSASQKNRLARYAFTLIFVGLFLNVGWFFVFFWMKSVFFGMVVIALQLIIIAAVIILSLRSTVLAALVIVPYFVILLFTTYANIMIFLMNPNLPLLGFVL